MLHYLQTLRRYLPHLRRQSKSSTSSFTPLSGKDYSINLLSKQHDRNAFNCGKFNLNDFLKENARNNDVRDLSKTYVLTPNSKPSEIIAYCTLAVAAIEVDYVPKEYARRLPPNVKLPVLHLARLAVRQSSQGNGHGTNMVLFAYQNAINISTVVGLHGVDAYLNNPSLKDFYAKLGMMELQSNENKIHMFAPIKYVRQLGAQAHP